MPKGNRKSRGRPPKLENKAIRLGILEILRAGNTRQAACRAVGISEVAFYDWLKRGATEAGSIYETFLREVERVEAECEVEMLERVRIAAQGYKTKTTRTKTQSHEEVALGPDGEPITDGSGNVITKRVTDTETIETEGHEFDWRAAQWWLERKSRSDWGPNVRVDVDDEITKLMAILAAGRQDQAAG